MTYTPQAGDTSFQVKWYDVQLEGNLRFQDRELRTELEANRLVQSLLEQGICEQVEIVKWIHSHNNFGCLPAIRSNSLSLTVYRLNELGNVAEEPVNIF